MTEDNHIKLAPFQSTLINFPEYITTIGLISVELNNLEALLAGILGGLLRIKPDTATVVYLTPKSATARLEIIENVAEAVLKDSTGKKYLEGILKKARKIFNKRHQHMHGLWGSKDGQVCRLDSPFDSKTPPTPVKIEELTDLVRDIRTLIEDVIKASKSLYAQAPSQDKSE